MTAPQPSTAAVQTYFVRAVDPDRRAYLAQFAPDAVVEDEGREHHGAAAIAAWRGEVPDVRYDVVDVAAAGRGVRAVARVSGDFPGSPVDLTFGFEFAPDGRIRRLEIRP